MCKSGDYIFQPVKLGHAESIFLSPTLYVYVLIHSTYVQLFVTL